MYNEAEQLVDEWWMAGAKLLTVGVGIYRQVREGV